MSYKISIPPKRRAAARFLSRASKSFIKTIKLRLTELEMSQKDLANKIGMDETVLSRALRGEANLTLRSIGEIAWGAGVSFSLVETQSLRAATDDKLQQQVNVLISTVINYDHVGRTITENSPPPMLLRNRVTFNNGEESYKSGYIIRDSSSPAFTSTRNTADYGLFDDGTESRQSLRIKECVESAIENQSASHLRQNINRPEKTIARWVN